MERRNIQFYVRKNKKNLLEIVESYDSGKVVIGFRSYSLEKEKGSRTNGKVDFYMKIDEFELLCHNLLSGNIVKKLKAGKEVPTYYKGSDRDGKTYSRMFYFASSERGVFFTATEGPGKRENSGAVKPLYEKKDAPVKVSISLSPEEVKSFALQGKRACDVYYMRIASGMIKPAGSVDAGEPSAEQYYEEMASFEGAENW